MIRMTRSLAISEVLITNQFDAQFCDEAFHFGTKKRIQLVFKLSKGGMGVKLGIADGELRKQSQDELLIHARILEQPEHALGVTNTRLSEKVLRPAREEFKNHHV